MSGHRYLALDGLRGVAAILVVVYHARKIFFHLPTGLAFSCVDFFFALSGFVLAHAYGQSIDMGGIRGGISAGEFLRRRLVRLYPLIVLGVAMGGFVSLMSPNFTRFEALTGMVGTLFFLPAGLLTGKEAYAVNNPLWSLAFEMVACAVFAILGTRRARSWAVVALVSAGLLPFALYFTPILEPLGFVGPLGFLFGFPRVGLSFANGVLVYLLLGERGPDLSARRGLSLAILVLPALVLALLPVRSLTVQALVLVPGIPALLYLASRLGDGGWPRLMAALGAISFPIYVVHMPLLRTVSGTIRKLHLEGAAPHAVTIAAVAVCLVVAWLVQKLYDRPARAIVARLLAPRRT